MFVLLCGETKTECLRKYWCYVAGETRRAKLYTVTCAPHVLPDSVFSINVCYANTNRFFDILISNNVRINVRCVVFSMCTRFFLFKCVISHFMCVCPSDFRVFLSKIYKHRIIYTTTSTLQVRITHKCAQTINNLHTNTSYIDLI